MLSTKVILGLVLAATFTADVSAHGQMTKPSIRPITSKYRADCYFGLMYSGEEELQLAPLENLIERKTPSQPRSPNFDVYNGCRGINYEDGMPVTEVTPGQSLQIEYNIRAPHKGYLEMGIVRPETTGGKIMYKRSVMLTRVEDFATSGGVGPPVTVKIPSDLVGCSKPGDCALQFYWYSDVAKQTYNTCADIVVKGGAAGGANPDSSSAPATAPASSSTPAGSMTPASDTSSAPSPTPAAGSSPATPPASGTPTSPSTTPASGTPTSPSITPASGSPTPAAGTAPSTTPASGSPTSAAGSTPVAGPDPAPSTTGATPKCRAKI